MVLPLASSAHEVVVGHAGTVKTWSVPHAADTTYLTHGYFRYIGKFPPQISAKLIDDYYPGWGTVLDPMSGGGTVLIEAKLRGLDATGWDINPVSLLVARCVTRRVDPGLLQKFGHRIVEGLRGLNGEASLFGGGPVNWVPKGLRLEYCSEYFSDRAKQELEFALEIVGRASTESRPVAEVLLLIILASLRRISFANVKKMNLELDLEKKTLSTLLDEFSSRLANVERTNRQLPPAFGSTECVVLERDATAEGWPGEHGMIVIHPPYLTNTAFSEATQLQLAVLGIGHKTIWRRELRCRGSFLHEPNGLQKYLVGWGHVIRHAAQALASGGRLAVVVGDGQVNYVRIPIGSISKEFAADAGLALVDEAFHVLNNHTGQTQNKKMRGQHVLVFEHR